MNYLNPYYYSMPFNYIQPKIGLLQKIFGSSGTSIGSFLNGTQRVLNIANQTIPIVKQVKPMLENAKTMLKIMNEFKRNEKETLNQNYFLNDKQNYSNNNVETNIKEKTEENDIGPTFFM